ncbi:periplasmic chaperone for outer membrane proteins Skp [Thioalbus denitrificans]|jgi:outer membrane protein|uniref:Periplasmic chaperone for outer membrane proteins Skp n=1 Tax=Thioalbus denitrificans TaxID=547122 RepID=A0A369BTX5_9GAMM|nr:periplasmic chaperone for outer membrane proteins Skp [Thioalbus denitrificans]
MALHNRIKRTAVIATLALSLGAAAAAGAAELKIGVVNAAAVMEKAPQAEAARSKLEKEFAPRNDELVAQQKQLKQMEDRLSRDGAVMSDDQRRSLERDILSTRRDVKRAQDEFRDDLNIRRNEELSKLQRQISDAIESLAKEQNFDVILTNANVIYSSKRVDITEDVVQRLLKAR